GRISISILRLRSLITDIKRLLLSLSRLFKDVRLINALSSLSCKLSFKVLLDRQRLKMSPVFLLDQYLDL
ncbi:MAG: hypothetical protein ACFFD4_37480, partial [Candidatus Odinarchaeota archaeon]